MYNIDYKDQALRDLAKLQQSDSSAFRKLVVLIEELKLHPRTGTGRPEQLKGEMSGRWSRRITKKHRLIYEIFESKVIVLVLAAYGHYNDK